MMNYRDFGIPEEKQTVVYNGIDTKIFRPVKTDKNKKDIIFVGNIEDGKKGFVYLLKALKRLKSDIRLVVVDGGAPHRKITNMLIDKLDLRSRVHFVGTASTADLVRLYSQSAIAAVPSVYEGFGFPAGEAMACGIPVISSDGGALPEVVGDAGVIVPARDVTALAEAIDSLINDAKRMKKFAEAGMVRVKKEFRWESAVRKLAGVYGNLKG
jgi:glycosyltransferase involved in cell wall biosynthesis